MIYKKYYKIINIGLRDKLIAEGKITKEELEANMKKITKIPLTKQ